MVLIIVIAKLYDNDRLEDHYCNCLFEFRLIMVLEIEIQSDGVGATWGNSSVGNF